MNGTIQEVYDELTRENPRYDRQLAAYSSKQEATGVVKRDDDCRFSKYSCGNGYSQVLTSDVRKEASYLRGIPGRVVLPPGKDECGQASCLNNVAIYWCNEVSIAIASCTQFMRR